MKQIMILAVVLLAVSCKKPEPVKPVPPQDNIEKTSVPTHACNDRTHQSCDGNCECDGLACHLDRGDYQFHMEVDGINVIQDGRFVQFLRWDQIGRLDSILVDDNE